MDGIKLMGNLAHDLRFTIRTFKKSPVFVAVAVLSLALGIGANTAIFTLVDQILLRLLPVKDPQQLVLLWGRGPHYGSNNGHYKLSYPMYEDFRDHNQVFSGMFCRWETSMSVSSEGKTERVDGELVSGTYFQVLGVGAALGRVFTPDDDRTPAAIPSRSSATATGGPVSAAAATSSARSCWSTAIRSPSWASARKGSTAPIPARRRRFASPS